jgi:hypothetical protein
MHYVFGKWLFAGAATLALTCGPAVAQTMTMATDAVGSSFNAIGAGISKIITEHSPRRVVVRATWTWRRCRR